MQLIFNGTTHLGVDKFYNSDIGPIPLTIVFGLRARVNPGGMKIARCGLDGAGVGVSVVAEPMGGLASKTQELHRME